MSIFFQDVGIKIAVETNFSLSQATTVALLYRTPSGRNGQWNGDVINGTQILYTTQPGDLNEVGLWTIQPLVITPTESLRGEPRQLKVSQSIQP